ncbi:MetS family NSS transporter small subunit [Orenia marismortui]|uniref:MetS family NSS transporter small subunit n=1 Tax=Orenia marismortui TaxID=46469 RepID=A0A4V3GYA6_9FIRM|nr:MetS family NSS transporter small subunit [Orenia marismortui]TDX51254.1 hypothetical protein C7959_1142 [Orenia marismortui]
MSISAILMFIFGSVILYGGLGYCVYRVVKREKERNKG